MFDTLVEKLKKDPKTIVFTEGPDARILEATARIKAEGIMKVVLVGNVAEVEAAAKKGGFDIEGVEIIDPETYAEMDEMVKMGKADCLLGGATYSTADTVRPALQLIKTKPGNSIVSSCFIMVRDKADGTQEKLAMGDCAINIHPTEDNLVEIAQETAKCAETFGIDPKVAFLSFSTKGSAKDDEVTKVQNAVAKAKEVMTVPVDGEMQFDAAVAPEVGQLKFPGSPVAGQANTFIFPDVTAGNIGYKIAARLGGFAAYGPILLGLNAPINDLSRGCNADEVYKMAIITAGLA